jgi:hypothetical protein
MFIREAELPVRTLLIEHYCTYWIHHGSIMDTWNNDSLVRRIFINTYILSRVLSPD